MNVDHHFDPVIASGRARGIVSMWMLTLAITLAVAPSVWGQASRKNSQSNETSGSQSIAPEDFERLIGGYSPFGTPPAASASSQSINQVSHENYGVVDPVSIQLAELQSQITSQEAALSQLRSQLNSPLRNQGRQSPRYFATYESVIVQPVQSNTSAFIVSTAEGFSQVMFPWKLEHSPRVEFGVMPAEGKLGFRMRYWQFDHSNSFAANDANGLIPVGFEGIVGYLTEDGDVTSGAEFIQEGTFTSEVRTDVLDWEVQRTLSVPIDLFAGIRYARVKQGYTAITDEGNVFADTEFRGIGPSAAMRFTHVLPLDKLSIFAEARGSLLFGNQDYTMIDSVNNIRQSLNRINVDDWSDLSNAMVTNAEIKFGIQYLPVNWLAMRVALEGQHFGDIGGPNPPAVFAGPDRGLSTDGPLDDDLGFYGLSVAIEAGY
ncbi:Lpg1974 family pore-forming outer membrane protein [Neorhodopirellula pilleata]|nr:Lpg1974 family pore-forming outer membrane protein [Neorhodopirellula pilleata]